MVDKDKPKVHFTAAKFVEGDVEPFVYMTKNNKRIAFPDPLDLNLEEAERMVVDFQAGRTSTAMQRWLSDDDYAAIKTEVQSVRQWIQLSTDVQKHYEEFFGGPGESVASAN